MPMSSYMEDRKHGESQSTSKRPLEVSQYIPILAIAYPDDTLKSTKSILMLKFWLKSVDRMDYNPKSMFEWVSPHISKWSQAYP